MRKKTFDCVEMQHRAGDRLRKLTAGMTLEEELDFWRREAEKFRARREKRAPERPRSGGE